jgi:DNA-directed RNA polymerase sigma subunit (sigma70/sigma32)
MNEYAMSAADEAQQRETLGVVWLVIQTLTPREQAVVVRRFFLGLTFAAIGKAQGLTGARIAQVYHKAIRRMRYPARLETLREVHEPDGLCPVAARGRAAK